VANKQVAVQKKYFLNKIISPIQNHSIRRQDKNENEKRISVLNFWKISDYLFFQALFPESHYILIFNLAGLLTYSSFVRPSHSAFRNSGCECCTRICMSLQQRVCSGLSPDSLFIILPEREG
jgi:hypothetical protein